MEMKFLFIVAILCPAFGLIREVWERKLIITRKCVSGTNGFSATVIGTLAGISGLWQLNASYIYIVMYTFLIITAYIIICILVKKEEYPESERFTKEL